MALRVSGSHVKFMSREKKKEGGSRKKTVNLVKVIVGCYARQMGLNHF